MEIYPLLVAQWIIYDEWLLNQNDITALIFCYSMCNSKGFYKTGVINDHSERPIVKPLATIVFCCFVFLDLKEGDGRTDNMCENNDPHRP